MNRERFKNIYFEIVGYCNANCPYCHSGVNKIGKGNEIDPGKFKSILMRLFEKDVVKKGTLINLYNWGEPLLHPEINRIIGCINELDLKYALSTNASLVPKIDKGFVKNLDYIIFSMPGFSERSFKNIHGLEFQTHLRNILKIIKDCRSFSFRGHFIIFYHAYRFNINELQRCERFADDNGIIFKPHYAVINHWWMLRGFLDETLPDLQRKCIKEDLFDVEYIKDKMGVSPEEYICPQDNFLVIDENGDVATCCQIPKDHKDYSCGNILEHDIREIFRKRKDSQVCRHCIDSGLAFYLNNSIAQPDFYRRGYRQNFLILKERLRRVREICLKK